MLIETFSLFFWGACSGALSLEVRGAQPGLVWFQGFPHVLTLRYVKGPRT